MTIVKAAMWVHGTTVQAEFPKRLAATDSDTDMSGFRRGWGTLFRGGDLDPVRASNWFHIPIPTPAILDDAKPLLKRVFVLYGTSPEQSRVRLTSLHLYDGLNQVAAFDDLVGYSGDHSSRIDGLNTWEIDQPLAILFGLGIAVGVDFSFYGNGGGLSDILFTAAGADFTLET